MTAVQRVLLAIAMLALPRDFRRTYAAQMSLDFEQRPDHGYDCALLFDIMVNGITMRIESLWRDTAHAIRSLIHAPAFAVIACGTLAIALAANAVLFGAVHAVLLSPLPYGNESQLAIVGVTDARSRALFSAMAPPIAFADVARHSSVIDSAAAIESSTSEINIDGSLVHIGHARVTQNYFSTLGVRPYIGALFRSGIASDQSTEVVISYGYWRTHYAGSASAIGSHITVDGRTCTIVGVAPQGFIDPDFGGASRDDLWTVFPRNEHAYGVMVLRTRSSPADLRRELRRLWDSTKGQPWQSYPPNITRLAVWPIRAAMLDNAQTILIFFVAAIILLLVSCANITNLILVRAFKRRDEFAVRAALGASTRRIVAQSMTETLVLCAIGCVTGVAIAAAFMRSILALIPGNLPRLNNAHLDVPMIAYTCLLALAAALVAGVVPALASAGKRIGASRISRTGTSLIVLQVAATFALLVCSGLLLRSLVTLTRQPLGFEPHRLYAATFMPKRMFFTTRPGAAPKFPVVAPGVLAKIQSLPGVSDAALAFSVPLVPSLELMMPFWHVDQPPPRAADGSALADVNQVTPEFFSTLHIPIIAGRGLTSSDAAQRVAVVNEAFARKFFGTPLPVGKTMMIFGRGARGTGGADAVEAVRIAGVVGDTRPALTAEPKPMAYFAFSPQSPSFTVVFHMNYDDPRVAAQIATLGQSLPQYRIPEVASFESALQDASAQLRATFILLAALTFIVLAVSITGIYGVVSFSVARRYHEIGVRLALGATKSRIVGEIVKSSLAQAVLGVFIGVVGAAFGARAIQSQLFKTPPFDPASFVAAAVALVVCVSLAAAIPAWRATQMDPARTLRFE